MGTQIRRPDDILYHYMSYPMIIKSNIQEKASDNIHAAAIRNTKGSSIERTPPPGHIQIGTVSLPANTGCVRASEG